MNRYLTLVKREYWENRGGFLWAPVVTGAIFLVLMTMAILVAEAFAGRSRIQIGTLELGRALEAADGKARVLFGLAIDGVAMQVVALIGIVLTLVVFFYCLSALYDERRDRSILFWKSLPVSDAETVLAKVFSAAVAAPAIAVGAMLLSSLALLMLLSTYFGIRGTGLASLVWTESHLPRIYLTLIAMLPVGVIFALPTIGWLLLCSAWARSKPLLWAVLLPLASGVLVAWFGLMQNFALPSAWYWKNVVGRLLLGVFPGYWMNLDMLRQLEGAEDPGVIVSMIGPASPYMALATPAPWVAAVAGLAMIAVAIRLRRRRELAD